MQVRGSIFVVFSLICLPLLVVALAKSTQPASTHLLIEQQMPEFGISMLTIPEGTVSHWDFRGQTSLLNVFASWCDKCVEERDIVMAISEQGDVQVLGLNWKDDRERAIRWLQKYGDPYARSAFDADGELARQLAVVSPPESLVVDGHGRIRYRHAGAITPEVWESTLKPIFTRIAREE